MASLPALFALVALQLLALAALLAVALVAGSPIARRLGSRPGVERIALAVATGLVVVGTALFWIAEAGALRRPVVLALATMAGMAAIALRGRQREAIGPPPEARGARLAFAGVTLALLPAFVATLYPPTGWDVRVYHLPFARAFAAAGRLVETPDLLFEIFPQFAETIFAALLVATRSELAPALVQLVAAGAVALLLFAAAERWISRRAGLWAAALWLAHPLVHYQAATAYVDAIQALFGVLALFAWERSRDERLRPRRAAAWLALSGAAAGAGAATKYPGLVWLALLALATLVAAPFGRDPSPPSRPRKAYLRLRAATIFVFAAALVGGPWYARIWAATNNPFHPFFDRDSGRAMTPADLAGSPWIAKHTEVVAEPLAGSVARRLVSVASRPGELARFTFDAAFDRARFDRQAPLAPWNLLLAPFAAWCAIRDARIRRWLLLVLGYALFWTTIQPRFQLVGAATFALAGAAAIERLAAAAPAIGRHLARRHAALGLATALVAPGLLYAAYKVVKRGAPPPVSRVEREAYLDREIAGYAGIAWIERQRGADYTVFLLGASNLTDFAAGRVRGQTRGQWRLSFVRPHLDEPQALRRALAGMGVDYLLVARSYRPQPRRDDEFRSLFRRVEGDARHDLYELVPVPQRAPATAATR